MIPPISIVIPLYIFIGAMGLMNTKLALILTYTSYMLPLVIWIMAAFFQSVPWDIEEAALIDGCTPLSALVRVIIPLATPGLVAAAIVAFLFAWNEFFFALIFTNTASSKTITKVISEFSSDMGAGLDYGLVTTGGILSSLPPVAIALFFQRFLVQGLTGGSVKS
jgi:multiple sugar transport system permease protein